MIDIDDGEITVNLHELRRWIVRIAVTAFIVGATVGLSFVLSPMVPWSTAAVTSVAIGLVGLGITVQYYAKRVSSSITAPPELSGALSRSTMFSTLSSYRRRIMVQLLFENPNPISIGALSMKTASKEFNKPEDSISAAERKRIYTAAYQTHLPTMAANGIVEYDKHRGNVSMTDEGEEVYECLGLFERCVRPAEPEFTRTRTDEFFHVIRNVRRRLTLYHLSDHSSGKESIYDLAVAVAARENDCEPSDVGQRVRKRVFTGLYQHHLDKMGEAGFIDWDQNEQTVELTERGKQTVNYLSLIEDPDTDTMQDVFWSYLR